MCLDFFIDDANAGPFKGDNRTFDPNAPASASRIQVVASADGALKSATISESCSVWGCRPPYPMGPGQPNQVTSQSDGNGGFTITVTGANSAAFGRAPAINASVTFNADGTTSGERDAMPALGVYRQSGGEWKPLQERYKAGAEFLIPGMPKDRW